MVLSASATARSRACLLRALAARSHCLNFDQAFSIHRKSRIQRLWFRSKAFEATNEFQARAGTLPEGAPIDERFEPIREYYERLTWISHRRCGKRENRAVAKPWGPGGPQNSRSPTPASTNLSPGTPARRQTLQFSANCEMRARGLPELAQLSVTALFTHEDPHPHPPPLSL